MATSDGSTPLRLTCLSRHTCVAKYLMQQGASVNLAKNGGPNSLDAQVQGFLDILNAGVD